MYYMKTRNLAQQTADRVWKDKSNPAKPHSHAGHHLNARVSLDCLNWNYK